MDPTIDIQIIAASLNQIHTYHSNDSSLQLRSTPSRYEENSEKVMQLRNEV